MSGGFTFGAPAPTAFGSSSFVLRAGAPAAHGGALTPAFDAPAGSHTIGTTTPATAARQTTLFAAAAATPGPAPAQQASAFSFNYGGAFGGGAAGPAPAPAPACSSTFGATPLVPTRSASAAAPAAGGFSFGGAPAPAPAPAGGFSFGGAAAPAPAPAGGLFGAPAPAPAPAGGLFGATAGLGAPLNPFAPGAVKVAQHQHVLKFHRRDRGYICDVCRRSFSAGDHSYYCSDCDFDACIACSSKYSMGVSTPAFVQTSGMGRQCACVWADFGDGSQCACVWADVGDGSQHARVWADVGDGSQHTRVCPDFGNGSQCACVWADVGNGSQHTATGGARRSSCCAFRCRGLANRRGVCDRRRPKCLRSSANCLRSSANCLRSSANCLRSSANCLRSSANCLRSSAKCLRNSAEERFWCPGSAGSGSIRRMSRRRRGRGPVRRCGPCAKSFWRPCFWRPARRRTARTGRRPVWRRYARVGHRQRRRAPQRLPPPAAGRPTRVHVLQGALYKLLRELWSSESDHRNLALRHLG